MDALQYQFIKNSSCDVAANSGNEIMIYAKSFQYVRENY